MISSPVVIPMLRLVRVPTTVFNVAWIGRVGKKSAAIAELDATASAIEKLSSCRTLIPARFLLFGISYRTSAKTYVT